MLKKYERDYHFSFVNECRSYAAFFRVTPSALDEKEQQLREKGKIFAIINKYDNRIDSVTMDAINCVSTQSCITISHFIVPWSNQSLVHSVRLQEGVGGSVAL